MDDHGCLYMVRHPLVAAFHPSENLLAHAGDDKDKDDYDMGDPSKPDTILIELCECSGSVKVFGFTRDNR